MDGGGGGGGERHYGIQVIQKLVKQNGHYTCFVLETLNSFFLILFFTFIAVATALLYDEN